VFLALSSTTLSPTSFMVVGALVAVALTYLSGVSSLAGALVAATLAQAGVVTTFMNGLSGGSSGEYVFAFTGLALIVITITAPEGISGVVRNRLGGLAARRRTLPVESA
jgi:ABC-type branched-subunit amino acid transport system permease subunit